MKIELFTEELFFPFKIFMQNDLRASNKFDEKTNSSMIDFISKTKLSRFPNCSWKNA